MAAALALQDVVTFCCRIPRYNFEMDNEPGFEIRFYRAAYQLVNWILFAIFYVAVMVAAYFSLIALGGFGLFVFISGVALLRLYVDIRNIKSGAVDLPAEYKAREKRKQRLRKSGRH